MADSMKNQGEGDRESAKKYNEDVRDFEDKEDVTEKAKEAEDQLEKDTAELEEAEEEGREKAKEFDPQVHRDRKDAEK